MVRWLHYLRPLFAKNSKKDKAFVLPQKAAAAFESQFYCNTYILNISYNSVLSEGVTVYVMSPPGVGQHYS
jgi:hypothetical protein